MIDSNLSVEVYKGLGDKQIKEIKSSQASFFKQILFTLNKGFENIRKNSGYDFALSMNTLQRDGYSVPLLNMKLVSRDESINMIEKETNFQFSWYHIYGDILTGKTTYLNLLAKRINEDKIIWIKCKDLNSIDSNMTIKLALSDITKTGITTNANWMEVVFKKLDKDSIIVIDDLPLLKKDDLLRDTLVNIQLLSQKNHVKVITSSKVNLPQTLTSQFEHDSLYSTRIPDFSLEEIIELAEKSDCPSSNINGLASWIGAVTKYNPTMVSACINYLELKNWQITNEVFRNIQEGFYSNEISWDVRNTLLSENHDEETKELLYRLSLIDDEFNKIHIDKLSQIAPKISHPYDKVQILEGYWLQRLEGKYRLSPFVKSIGESNLEKDIIKSVHYSIAELILQNNTLSPFEFVKMFTHLINAEEYNKAAQAYIHVLLELNSTDIEKDYWGISLIWKDVPLPKEVNRTAKIMIRAQQVISAIKFNNIPDFFLSEVENEMLSNEDDDLGEISISLAIGLIDYDTKLSLKYLKRFFEKSSPKKMDEINTVFQDGINIEDVLWFYPVKMNGDIETIELWLEILDLLNPYQVDKLLLNDNLIYDSCMFLTDNIWNKESKIDVKQRQWQKSIDAIKKVAIFGETKNIPSLFAGAIRSLIIIHFEFLDEEQEAMALYEESLAILEDLESQFLLHSIIGKQYMYKNNYAEALKFFHRALASHSTIFLYESIETLILTAVCERKTESNNSNVFSYLEKSKEIVRIHELDSTLIDIKIKAEYGIYYFNEGMFINSYNIFKESLSDLNKISEKNHQWMSLIVVFSHVLGYISSVVNSGKPPLKTEENEDYAKPEIGFFWIENSERYKFYTETRNIHIKSLMGIFSSGLGLYDEEYLWLKSSLDESVQKGNDHSQIICLAKRSLVPHLIIEKNVEEAIRIGIESSLELIGGKNKEVLDPFKKIDLQKVLKDREALEEAIQITIPLVFIPIAFQISNIRIRNVENSTLMVEKLIQSINDLSILYGKEKMFEDIKKIFVMVFIESHKEQEILNAFNTLSSGEKVISYIGISLKASKKKAIEIHLKIIEYLYKTFQRDQHTFLNIVLPFFQSFWLNSYIAERNAFEHQKIIDEHLEELLYERKHDTLKKLISLMKKGLDIECPDELLNFLKSK